MSPVSAVSYVSGTTNFKGSVGAKAANLDVHSSYGTQDGGELFRRIRNFGEQKVTVNLLDAYTGNQVTRHLRDAEEFDEGACLNALHGWHDVIVTVAEDPSFNYRLAGLGSCALRSHRANSAGSSGFTFNLSG